MKNNISSLNNLTVDVLSTDKTWWIAKVKTNNDKAFARDLDDLGIGYYLPLYESEKSTLKKKFYKPVFPSYVPFTTQESPYSLLANPRVSTIISVKNQDKFKKQLSQVCEVFESDGGVKKSLGNNFMVGNDVVVSSGPLKNLQGKVAKKNGARSVLITVEGLGCVILNVDIKDLKNKTSKCINSL